MGTSRQDSRRADGAGSGFLSGDREAVSLLWKAHQQIGPKDDPWQEAVTLAELRQAGVRKADLRRMIRNGLVEYRVEATTARSKRRRFQKWDNLSIPERSCFILTERGVTAASGAALDHASDGAAGHAGHGGHSQQVGRPYWDGVRRLYWASEVIKEFRRMAPDQMPVLEECQRQGWTREISLKPIVVELKKRGIRASLWIENTVRNLNKGLRGIRFHEDSKEQVIRWEPVGS
jgi:hypothetical protein